MFRDTSQTYGFVSKLFHWLSAVIIISLISAGFLMTSMPPSDEKWQIYFLHKSFGVLMLVLVLFRIVWRNLSKKANINSGDSTFKKATMLFVHYLMYMCMLLLPLSGILMSRSGGFDINVLGIFTIPAYKTKNPELAKLFNASHEMIAIVLSVLIFIHVAAAIYHQFILKDKTLSRML